MINRLFCTAATVAALILSASSCAKSPRQHITVYVAAEVATEQQKVFTEDVLHTLSREVRGGDELVIDIMQGSRVINPYSDRAKASSIREVMHTLSVKEASSSALVSALQRVKNLGQKDTPTTAFILTGGTCEAASLHTLATIIEDISTNTKVYVLGLKPENRLCMSSVFAAVHDRVKFAASEEEWIQAVRSL